MLVLVIIALVLVALLLLLRFVQPEFIYSIRRGLVMVDANKAFIDKMAGRDDVDGKYKQLLVSETRLESRTYDEMFILQDRIVKISELYRLLDSRRQLVRSQKPQVCIVELGGLLTNLGRDVEANPEHNAPVVKAGALLKYIADGILASRNENPLDGEEDVDRWFIENPISIEQVVELLISSVVALAHRQHAARSPAVREPTADDHDVLPKINKLEKRLRLLVRLSLQKKYKGEYEVSKQVQENLGEASYHECLGRMEKVRKERPDLALDFFDFVYWVQLRTLIFMEWDVFQPIFREKPWLEQRVDRIVEIRNAETRNQTVSDEARKQVIAYCREIGERLGSITRPPTAEPG